MKYTILAEDKRGLLVRDFIGHHYFITGDGQKFFLLPDIARILYDDMDQVTNFFEEEI